ncbi:MAG TPA: 3-isopropylmalate dehydratase small subunit [Armatimonadaceae bacterium]|nr:3-isopropylmalate dehydratase small subunit [Armatimonadaceae bacterium]
MSACVVRVTDREAIRAYYRPNAAAHLYEIGDLDDFFWPHTAWYALEEGGKVRAIALLYAASDDLSILLAATEPAREGAMRHLLTALAPEMPERVYAHLNVGAASALVRPYRAESHGVHYRMALADAAAPQRYCDVGEGVVVRLSPADRDEVEAFYRAAYPRGWFDLRMLETGQYVGVRRHGGEPGSGGGELLCVAGVHVCAPRERVAALGNVATLPHARGQGLATRACAALCRNLLAEGVEHVGLNVRADNRPAARCYEKLGFTRVARYEECLLTRRKRRNTGIGGDVRPENREKNATTMQPFTKLTAVAAPMDRVNVDTDQIIPKQFLKRIERTGFGQFLFFDWRYLADGTTPNPEFELNAPALRGAKVLVVGKNFGCGSSREHAPWALLDYGFESVIAPSFADIFYNNCFKNGILPVTLPEEQVYDLMGRLQAEPGAQVTVDLERCVVEGPGGFAASFEVDPFRRECLLKGLDDIGLTLQHEGDIDAYEQRAGKVPAAAA